PSSINGPWELSFPPGLGAPEKVTLDKLVSWSDHPEAGVKYFSGTATYRTTLHIAGELLGDGRRLLLDLGHVEVSARVTLNSKDLGVAWKKPYEVDITAAAVPGENRLEIEVVNLWINRLIGDEFLAEDCLWKEEGRGRGQVLAEYPQWLLEGKPSPTGRITFKTWKHYGKDSPLVPSGLLGPVRLVPMTQVNFK
ncbi:MAG: glycosylhydrolase-like jelly roll fold domain-containing protein, partial [Thermoguttaceae bacterium]